MPYKMRKLPNKKKYRVYNAENKKIYSYATTKKKAEAQLRLLRIIEKKKKIIYKS